MTTHPHELTHTPHQPDGPRHLGPYLGPSATRAVLSVVLAALRRAAERASPCPGRLGQRLFYAQPKTRPISFRWPTEAKVPSKSACLPRREAPLLTPFSPKPDHFSHQELRLQAANRRLFAKQKCVGGGPCGEWVAEAVTTELKAWRQGWAADGWQDQWPRIHDVSPNAMIFKIEKGNVTVLRENTRYKGFRRKAYRDLFVEVARLDWDLNVTIFAHPSDSCPGNAVVKFSHCAGCSNNSCCSDSMKANVTLLYPRRQFSFPFLCFQRQERNLDAALLPEIQMMYSGWYQNNRRLLDPFNWSSKLPNLYFRGAFSGRAYGLLNQRVRVCSRHELVATNASRRAKLGSNITTVASMAALPYHSSMPGNFSCGVNIPKKMKGCFHPLQKCTGAEFDLASNHSFRDALQAKFMLSMDGHGAACVRVFDTLMSNSLLLKMEAPYPVDVPSRLYFHSAFRAWKHFIPVTESNLASCLKWLAEHDDFAASVAQAGRMFALKEYSKPVALRYTHLLLSTLAALQRPTALR